MAVVRSRQTLADKGARLVVLNRKSERADQALQKLKEHFPDSTIDGVECDLKSFISVRKAAEQVKELLVPEGCVDVLCNNAGVMAMKDEATVDGYDVQMQVNHLSHFLLTKELYPLLLKASDARGEARIVNHSSIARLNPNRPVEAKSLEKNGGALGGDGKVATWTRYQQTKRANGLFTYALRDRFEAKKSNVKAMLAHPGVARTALIANTGKDGAGFTGVVGSCLQWMFSSSFRSQTEEDGTLGILSCMCLSDAPNGAFYGPGKKGDGYRGPAVLISPEKEITDKTQIELLWSKSEEAIGDKFEI